MKILVLRFSSLGDIVMTTAMIRCLRKRFPFAQIDMVVRSDFAELIQHNPHLDQKIVLNRGTGAKGLWELYRRLNRETYDVIYDAHLSLRTLLLMPFLKGNRKVYFNKHYVARALALTFKLPLIRGMKRFLERFIDPLESLGVVYDGLGPEVFVPADLVVEAHKTFQLEKYPSLVGIIPSAQWPGKRWPENRFREVLADLLKTTAHSFVIFGGPKDDFCKVIADGLPTARVLNLQGKANLLQAAAVLQKCEYVIANDTGLMHLADAVNVPQVLILGPTSTDLGCAPFHPMSQLAEVALWCRPCSKNGQAPCIRATRRCLSEVSVDSVVSLAHRVESLRLVPGGL